MERQSLAKLDRACPRAFLPAAAEINMKERPEILRALLVCKERGESTMYYRHLQEDAAQEDESEEDRYRFRSLQEQHVGGDMKIHGFETPKSVDRH